MNRELCPFNFNVLVYAQKKHLAYFVSIDGHFGQIFKIWTSHLFCPLFTLTFIYKLILKSIRPKLAILSPKITKMAIR